MHFLSIFSAFAAVVCGSIGLARICSSGLFGLLLLPFRILHLVVRRSGSGMHIDTPVGASIREDGFILQVVFLHVGILRRVMLALGQVIQDLLLHELLAEDARQLLNVALEDFKLVTSARRLLATC